MSLLQSRTRSAREGFGRPVRRVEDQRLLTGRGCYSDDFNVPGQVYACFVRSPHAHARIVRLDAAAALKVPGVIAVLTGADVAADGLKPIPHRPVPANPYEPQLRNRDGAPHFVAPHPPLPTDARVRLVGEAVAMVIAETAAAARDGAEAVSVEYEPLPVVTAALEGAAPGAALVWDEAGSNVCVDSETGDAAAADAAFARAAYVVRLETQVNRVTGVPMEPRAALAVYDAEREHSRSTPARAACSGSSTTSWRRSGFRAPPCASSRGTWAAITARATRAIPSSRWCPGRPAACAAR